MLAVPRFESEEALAAWRDHPENAATQEQGRDLFFEDYWIDVCSTIRRLREPAACSQQLGESLVRHRRPAGAIHARATRRPTCLRKAVRRGREPCRCCAGARARREIRGRDRPVSQARPAVSPLDKCDPRAPRLHAAKASNGLLLRCPDGHPAEPDASLAKRDDAGLRRKRECRHRDVCDLVVRCRFEKRGAAGRRWSIESLGRSGAAETIRDADSRSIRRMERSDAAAPGFPSWQTSSRRADRRVPASRQKEAAIWLGTASAIAARPSCGRRARAASPTYSVAACSRHRCGATAAGARRRLRAAR
jgi:hypothetical protein